MSVGIIASLNSSRSWHFLLSDLSFFSLSLSSQRTTPPCVTFLWVVGGGRTVVTLLLQVQFMNMLWHQTILYHLKHVPTMILKSVSISAVLMLTEVQNSATRKDCFINIHFHDIFTNKFFHLQLKSPEVHFYYTSKKCNCEPSAFIHIVYDLCHRGQLLSSRNGVFSDIKWNTVFYVVQIHTELLRVCEQRSAEYWTAVRTVGVSGFRRVTRVTALMDIRWTCPAWPALVGEQTRIQPKL